MNLTAAEVTKLALALGACWAVYKFAGKDNAMVKTAAVAVGAVIVTKRLPYVGPALA